MYCTIFTCIHLCLNSSCQVGVYQYFLPGFTHLPASFRLVSSRISVIFTRFHSFISRFYLLTSRLYLFLLVYRSFFSRFYRFISFYYSFGGRSYSFVHVYCFTFYYLQRKSKCSTKRTSDML